MDESRYRNMYFRNRILFLSLNLHHVYSYLTLKGAKLQPGYQPANCAPDSLSAYVFYCKHFCTCMSLGQKNLKKKTFVECHRKKCRRLLLPSILCRSVPMYSMVDSAVARRSEIMYV